MGQSPENTQEYLAQLTGLSQQRISQLQREGVIAKGENPIVSNRKIVAHLGSQKAGWKSQDGKLDRIAEAAMLDRRRREEIELRLAERREELFAMDSIVEIVKFTVLAVRNKFLALPSRLRSLAPDLSTKHYGIVEQLVREAISEFNAERFPPGIRQATEQYFHRLHAAAEIKDRPNDRSITDV